MIHVHRSENVSDCQRVGNIGFATTPKLAGMGLFSVIVGAFDVVYLRRFEVGG